MKNLVLTLSVLCFAPSAFGEDFFKTAQALKRSVLETSGGFSAEDLPEYYVRQAYDEGWSVQDIIRTELYAAGIKTDVAKIKTLWDPDRAGDQRIYREFAARLAVLNYINSLPTLDAVTLLSLVREIPPLHRFEDYYIKPAFPNSTFKMVALLPRLRFMDPTRLASEKLFATFLKTEPDRLLIEQMQTALDLDSGRARWLVVKTRVSQTCGQILERFGIEF